MQKTYQTDMITMHRFDTKCKYNHSVAQKFSDHKLVTTHCKVHSTQPPGGDFGQDIQICSSYTSVVTVKIIFDPAE